jgi:hypothetical protein
MSWRNKNTLRFDGKKKQKIQEKLYSQVNGSYFLTAEKQQTQ